MLKFTIAHKKNLKRSWAFLVLLTTFCLNQVFAIEPFVESDLYDQIIDLEKKGNIVVEGERRGYITQNIPLKHNMSLGESKEYMAVVVTDKNLSQIDLKIKNRKGYQVKKSSKGEQLLLLKISPLSKSDSFSFQLDTRELGGYYHFFLISESKKTI